MENCECNASYRHHISDACLMQKTTSGATYLVHEGVKGGR